MFFTKICLLVIKFSWYVRSKMARRLCDVDGQAFYGEKSVYEHNKMHLGIKYECVMCQKTFSTENYLKNHAKVVHFQGQNTCKACDAVFTTGRDLRRHENSVHGKKTGGEDFF